MSKENYQFYDVMEFIHVNDISGKTWESIYIITYSKDYLWYNYILSILPNALIF